MVVDQQHINDYYNALQECIYPLKVSHQKKVVVKGVTRIVSAVPDTVPFLYFEAVVFSSLISIMTNPEFPFSALGSVHARSQITRLKILKAPVIVS